MLIGSRQTRFARAQRVVRVAALGLAAAWLAQPFAQPAAAANDDEDSRPSLRGLPGVHVVVESLLPQAESAGFHRQAYERAIVTRLQEAGVPVLTVEANPTDQYVLAVHVTVSITTNSIGLVHPYSILMELRQPVVLFLSGESALATTWWTNSTGIGGTEWVKRSVSAMTDAFVAAWQSVN